MIRGIPLQRVLVTGCAGFIGSNLVDDLLDRGLNVIGIDNLSTGRLEFLHSAMAKPGFTFFNVDLQVVETLPRLFQGVDMVCHLAANADVRFGPDHPRRDLEQNTIVTHNVLEAMRLTGVKKIVFSSTGSIYGESPVSPTPEDAPFPIQTSLYGASKLAGEALIQAYCESFGFQSWIFRFVSILGPRYSHGHVFDFYKQLRNDENALKVLGDGHQRKSYLHVKDCIEGIKVAIEKSSDKVNIFNLGVDATCEVRDSIGWITEKLGVHPQITFGTDSRGWIGDNPLIHLSTNRINALGWMPKYSIQDGVEDTVKFLSDNDWLWDAR
jgi:UDP-glucose 4-epimerase